MKAFKKKWVPLVIVIVIFSLTVWWHFVKPVSSTVTIATLIAVDSESKVIEIKTDINPIVKISYKHNLEDLDIGKSYLIEYNNYKFQGPVLSSIRE